MVSSVGVAVFAALLTTSEASSLDDSWLDLINEYRAKDGYSALRACGSAEQAVVQESVEYDIGRSDHAWIHEHCPDSMTDCLNKWVCPDGQIPVSPINPNAGPQCVAHWVGDTVDWETGVGRWYSEGPTGGNYQTMMSDATCVSCYAHLDLPCWGSFMLANCNFCNNPVTPTTPTTTAAPTPAPTTTAAPTPAPTTTAVPTPAPHHDCEENQPGCGQRMIWVPNCVGAGCFANGKEQDCAWCVYDLGKCDAHYGSACDELQKAREKQGVSCVQEMSV